MKNSNKPYIFQVITGLGTGGAESMLSRLCAHKSDDLNFLVISLSSSGDFGEKIEKSGVEVVALELKANPLRLFKVFGLIRKYQPIALQGWMYHANLLVAIFSLMTRVPCYWNIRQSVVSLEMNKVLTVFIVRISALLSSVPEKIIYCAEGAIAFHEGIGYRKDKAKVIFNGFDLDILVPSEKFRAQFRGEIGVDEHTWLIGNVGRFAPSKDQVGFIKVAKLIHEQLPNTMFVMVGKNVDQHNDQLTNEIKKQGLQGVIELLGQRDDLPHLYPGLDLYLQTSISEGFPNVVGEAMACNVPVVGTDVGDTRVLVESQAAICKAKDYQQLADNVIAALGEKSDPRRTIEARFDITVIAGQYEQFYLQDINQPVL